MAGVVAMVTWTDVGTDAVVVVFIVAAAFKVGGVVDGGGDVVFLGRNIVFVVVLAVVGGCGVFLNVFLVGNGGFMIIIGNFLLAGAFVVVVVLAVVVGTAVVVGFLLITNSSLG